MTQYVPGTTTQSPATASGLVAQAGWGPRFAPRFWALTWVIHPQHILKIANTKTVFYRQLSYSSGHHDSGALNQNARNRVE